MEEFVLHLLVLSHVFVVPQLKEECMRQLEQGLLTIDNVIDIFQLALLCDAPRLNFICHRMILRNFKAVSATEGWQAMKQSHPVLERKILESVTAEDHVNALIFLLFFLLLFLTLILQEGNSCFKFICRGKKRGSENQRRERFICNYMRQWRLLFIYAEMAVRQLAHMIRTSEQTRSLVSMQPVRGWNCLSAILPVASWESLVAAFIARECGSYWSYTPGFVPILMSAEFLCAGEPTLLSPLHFHVLSFHPLMFWEIWVSCTYSRHRTDQVLHHFSGTLRKEVGDRARRTRLSGEYWRKKHWEQRPLQENHSFHGHLPALRENKVCFS